MESILLRNGNTTFPRPGRPRSLVVFASSIHPLTVSALWKMVMSQIKAME
jgi:hypothetical protein